MRGKVAEGIIREHSKYSSSLGLLPIAYKFLFHSYFNKEYKLNRWGASEMVAEKLDLHPLEILVLDRPTGMLPEKRKELIENPGSLFGQNYGLFLKYVDELTKDNGRALKVDSNIFSKEILSDLSLSETPEVSYRKVIEEKAKSEIRNKLPYKSTESGPIVNVEEDRRHKEYNEYYDSVARQTKDGILAAFKEYVEHNIEGPEEYKERIALLAGLTAIEILFVPQKSRRFIDKIFSTSKQKELGFKKN